MRPLRALQERGGAVKTMFFISSLECGGAERVVSILANFWANAGRIVSVVTLSSPHSDAYVLAPSVDRIGLDVASGDAGIVANARRFAALAGVMREKQPDLVISMMPSSNVLLALARAFAPAAVCVGSERVSPTHYALRPVWHFLRAVGYSRLDAIVAQTVETRDWLERNTLARRVAAIPNPVLVPLPSAPPSFGPDDLLPEGTSYVLAVGRLDDQKGFDILIDAYAAIARRCPEVNLVILGEGRARASLAERATNLGVADRLLMPGRCNALSSWYTKAMIFVLSSRFEGFPNALLEAMAHGAPSIAFDCPTGPKAIIEHGVTGLLLPPGDARALSDSLVELYSRPSRRSELGEKARASMLEFSPGRVAERWDKLFADLIATASDSESIRASE
jgi:glycosyltransferase involved in cell wall biosynthesis